MKKHAYLLLFFGAFTLVLGACKKESTRWNTDWNAPIAYGHLTIENMIPAKFSSVNSDDYLSIVINKPILTFSLDTLLDLPDTTISRRLSTGIPSATFDPDDEILYEYDQQYTLGEIELKAVRFKEGTATIDVLSPWGGKLEVDFSLPNTTKGGVVLNRLYYLDAGTPENQANGVDVIDLSGHLMEMTGLDKNQFNTFTGKMLIGSNEEVNEFTVSNLDSITYDFTFNDLVADYARGYFGTYAFGDTSGFDLGFMDKIVAGSVDLDSIRLDLKIRNGFNLIAQSKITQLTGINTKSGAAVELDFPLKNTTININRADGGLYDYVPSEYPITINNSNSNVIEFLENLSDSVVVGYDLNINPYGNITGGDDEFFPDSKMEFYLDGEFPLNFGANNLTIQDTLKIDFDLPDNQTTLKEGTLHLDYVNAFPFGAAIKVYLLDDQDNRIDSLHNESQITAANYNEATFETTPYKNTMTFPVPNAKIKHLEEANRLIVSVAFSSDGGEKVKIKPNTFFDFNLRSDLQIKIEL